MKLKARMRLQYGKGFVVYDVHHFYHDQHNRLAMIVSSPCGAICDYRASDMRIIKGDEDHG